jgi:hypothetical protein
VKETASSAISAAATAIGATAGNAGSVQASKVAAQQAGQVEDVRNTCAVYRDLAVACARSYVSTSLLACVGDDCYEGGPFFDTALLGEVGVRAVRQQVSFINMLGRVQVVHHTGGQLHFVTGALMHEDNVLRLEQQLVADLEDVSIAIALLAP